MTLNYQMICIQCQIFKITSNESLKKCDKSPINPPIHIYINGINKGLVFKIKDGYMPELQTPETMKLFGSTKKLIDKIKGGENVPSLEVVKIVLVQCNLEDDQYHQNSEVLYNFMPNKSYSYLLNVEPSNLVFLKPCNTEFDEIIITFNDQNCRLPEREDKVNLTFLINEQNWYLIL